MNFPMSVYQMVVNCLELTSPNIGQPNQRVNLTLHLLGTDVQLNCLPLLSELALLLPYHNIKLVLFGTAVARLVKEAKELPGCLANRSPVFVYTSPPECGSGTVTIYLNSDTENWPARDNDFPDALLACNAGLGSSSEWLPIVQAAHLHHIPFATTAYAEQSAELQRSMIPIMIFGTSHASPQHPEENKVQLNPFQRPGQRQIPMYKVPNVVNGFTLVVYKKAKYIEDGIHGQPEVGPGGEAQEIVQALCNTNFKLDELD
ncbi:hypothetical protein HYPSUDRAFT_151683 [Hypholoma sublateritium FD-334 SS-4]|uniref:Mitochondrial splicing suppressor 51-like C-terminal domain-containing protein n=1 Tax=Hypholoma sublateritium (strain FD-334 SS-4) TaxID=945553 RepID=A0A0D2LR92_HYPSF|nr:hypothetical protein HYPSUDRAFT_151683 [Hypholoma sublateritium FD-334 SS-4]